MCLCPDAVIKYVLTSFFVAPTFNLFILAHLLLLFFILSSSPSTLHHIVIIIILISIPILVNKGCGIMELPSATLERPCRSCHSRLFWQSTRRQHTAMVPLMRCVKSAYIHCLSQKCLLFPLSLIRLRVKIVFCNIFNNLHMSYTCLAHVLKINYLHEKT